MKGEGEYVRATTIRGQVAKVYLLKGCGEMSEESEKERVEKQRSLDESTTFLTNSLPSLWFNLFVNLKTEGFDEYQALSLVKCYILCQAANGVHIHKD